MYNEDVVHLYNGILLSHRKGEILPFATIWMDLEGIMLSKICQMEKYENCMISLVRGIGNKKETNEQTKHNKLMGTEERRVVTRGQGGVGG